MIWTNSWTNSSDRNQRRRVLRLGDLPREFTTLTIVVISNKTGRIIIITCHDHCQVEEEATIFACYTQEFLRLQDTEDKTDSPKGPAPRGQANPSDQ